MLWRVLFKLLISIGLVNSVDVTTSYGILRGTNLTTSDGTLVHLFKSIPQAEPPIGDLRYQLPRAPKSWNGIKEATEYSAACMSNSTTSSSPQKKVAEDCLYLNLFVPDKCISSNDSCPVIIYLHGGKLSYDSAVMFNDTFISEHYSTKGIIFAIPAMRLGSFGLLTFEDASLVHKNLPVYDVLLGLEWINKEIVEFGGDNKQVTLMGHSMGGSLGYMLSLSPEIDPEMRLYQKVIPMSGDVFFSSEERMFNASRQLLRETGCGLSTEQKSFDCIRRLNGTTILAAQRKVEELGYLFSAAMLAAPLANPGINYKEWVKDAPPRDMLCGGTSEEFGMIDDSQGLQIGSFLGLEHEKDIAEKYYLDKSDPNNVVSKFPSYLSQVVFVTSVRYGSQLEAKGANVFLYEYDQPPHPKHATDMQYFIGHHTKPVKTKDDEVLLQHYVNSISNFAKGEKEPLPGWKRLNGSETNYFSLRSEISKGVRPHMKSGYHPEIVDYWLNNMTEIDLALSEESSPGVFVVALVLVIIVLAVAFILMFCRRNSSSAENIPLLSKDHE